MKIISKDKLTYSMIENAVYIEIINFSSQEVLDLIDKGSRCNLDSIDIENLLNTINDQNLHGLDLQTYSYYRNNAKLAFGKLARSERLFLLSYIADKTHTECYFEDDIRSLTAKTLVKYMLTFGRSKYVNLVVADSNVVGYYEHVKDIGGTR